jgi:cytochrome c-type biogenesis protein
MDEVLTNWLDSTQVPILSAIILGLMTAISPCPLATNITAIGYIGKDLGNRNRIFINGLVYTAGRTISYFGIALILFFGASQFKISGFFQLYGEKIIGPALVLIGIFMLDFIKLNFSFLNKLTDRYDNRGVRGYWNVLLLGILFALAFCPYSAVLYFGMLIPMTLGSPSGLQRFRRGNDVQAYQSLRGMVPPRHRHCIHRGGPLLYRHRLFLVFYTNSNRGLRF